MKRVCPMRSSKVTMAASALDLIMAMSSLPKGRSATIKACGHTMWREIRYLESPRAAAASICPLLTDAKAPRMISAW